MSGTLKVLLAVAAAGVVVSAGLAYTIVAKKNEITTERDKVQIKLQSKEAQLKKIESDLKAKQTALAEKESQLDAVQSRAQSLESKLTAAEKKASDLDSSVKDSAAKVAKAQAEVQKINAALDGEDPLAIKSRVLKTQEDLMAVRSEQRILQDQLQSARTEVQRVTQLLRSSTEGKLPPGVSGKVETVNRTWNFVVLNVGDKDNVVRNGILIVYRGNQYIGKVKIVSTEAHTAVADILPEWSKGDIQAGDDVLN